MEKSKKQDIINACFIEFSKHGYDKANTNIICEQAGVSKGLLFHYFGSKKKLYILVIEKCIEDLLKNLECFCVDNLDFLQSINAYTQMKSEFFAKNPLHYSLLAQAFFNTPDDVKEYLSKKYSELISLSIEKTNELINKLELKDEVSKDNALQIILAVTGIIEKKYTDLIARSNSLDNELFENMKKDYNELINIVLYGMSK